MDYNFIIMCKAQVISVNPGRKTLGELHHPYSAVYAAGRQLRAGKVQKTAPGFFSLSKADMRRPVVAATMIRVLVAALVAITAVMADNQICLVGAAIAVLILAGLYYRFAVVAAVGFSFYCFISMLTIGEMPVALTLVGAMVSLALLALATGPGRLSVDAAIYRRNSAK